MPLSYPTRPGDLDHLIADDHAIVERQFQHLEAGRGDRRVLVDQIGFELAMHAFAEETVLYPLWREVGMEEENSDAREEHARIKELLVTLNRSEPGEEDFESALTELMQVLRHHVADEENEELPAFRAEVGAERMAELGKEFLAQKRKAPTEAHPHAPDGGGIEKLVGVLTKPVDLARAAVTGKQKYLATDASGLLDPQAQEIANAHSELTPLPFEILEPQQARRQPGPDEAVRVLLFQRGVDAPEPVRSVENLLIPDAGGGRQLLRIYTPAGTPEGPLPVIFWIHGGGWVLFDVDTYDASCRGLANKTGAMVVTPNYRRAPEDPFPAAHEDVLAAYHWTLENAAAVGGNPHLMGIGGESVGATMAVATCRHLAETDVALPRAQVCVYPLTTPEQFGDSMHDAADGRPLNRALLSWMAMHAFEGKPEAARDPRVDLLSLGSEDLAVLPPTLVITAERDVLRDQGEEFARRLEAAGVPTTCTRYPGVMHEFFGASAVLDKAEQAQRQAAQHFLEAFAAAGVR